MEGVMRIVAMAGAAVLAGAAVASAAEPATLGIGSRVRIQQGKDKPRLVGVIAASDAETLTLSLEQGETRIVPWHDVRKIDVSRGRRSAGAGALRGAGIGLATGAAAGIVAGLVAGDDPPCAPDEWCLLRFSSGDKMALGGTGLGVTGAALGAALGAFGRGERWAPAGEHRVNLAPQTGPGGHGAGLALRLEF
jgi:hypothetical protein